MKANQKFHNQSKPFWANVRTISQQVGYTVRGENIVKVPTLSEIKVAYAKLGLSVSEIITEDDDFTENGKTLEAYFKHRADVLNNYVAARLYGYRASKK